MLTENIAHSNFHTKNLVNNTPPVNPKVKIIRPKMKKLVDFQCTDQGELIYESPTTGYFLISQYSIVEAENGRGMPFIDCPITVRNIKDCYVSNFNLIHTDSNIFANTGYHFETPSVDINTFGLLADEKLTTNTGVYEYEILQEPITLDTGFYIGDTDNFGHWLFEFLPKALWYVRLFPKQDIPIIIGKSIPEKWLELLLPLGIDLTKILYFDSGKTYKFNNLINCTSSIKRVVNAHGAVRSEDFMALRCLIEKYYQHVSYSDRVDCLFCTRKNARWRKIVNEQEVIAWLKSNFNVETFEPENLSIKDQLMMLGKTKLFFGNGGSTPFSMFQPKDSFLFEIRAPGGHGIVGRAWPDIFRFGYHLVETDFAENKAENSDYYHHKDLIINLEKFKDHVIYAANISGLFPGKRYFK